jgi:hypothetical protein
MRTNSKVIAIRPISLIICMLLSLYSWSLAESSSEQHTGTLIVAKLPPPELYAHENKMTSTLDYDDSAEARKARVEWARKHSTVWVKVDELPKQQVTTTASTTFDGLVLDRKHLVTFYSESGEPGISFFVDFRTENAEKLKLDYSPSYGNWRVTPVRGKKK